MSVKVVVFDWDGTLVDSEQHIVSCISHAASLSGLPRLSYNRMKSIIGLGMKEALLDLYPSITEDQVQSLRRHYSQRFHSDASEGLELFAGVEETLSALKGQGVRLAVATGKSRRGLEIAKETSGLGAFFEIERCADETRSKPHPQMLHELIDYFGVSAHEMVMVGDTSYDMEMASRANMPSIGVSYGVHHSSELQNWKPRVIVDQMPELLEWIDVA